MKLVINRLEIGLVLYTNKTSNKPVRSLFSLMVYWIVFFMVTVVVLV